MRRPIKVFGIVLGSLAGLLVAAVAVIYLLAEARLNQTYAVPEEPIPIPTDAAAIARGEHLVQVIFFCTDCHGERLEGQVLFEDTLTGRLAPNNLTSGQGGLGRTYTDADWVRAILHGVDPDGKAGIAMASNIFTVMSDSDVGAMIAYLKSLPPIDNNVPPTRLGLVGRLSLLIDPWLLPAAHIDHNAPRPPAPEPGLTPQYGQYLAKTCTICHGDNYAGFPGPDGSANLTPGGRVGGWSEADFVRTLRTGLTPEGDELDPELMPWRTFGQMTDDELSAIWLFLQTLPPVATEPS
jgi:mono/diheme cytochrome c family protein